MLTKYIEYLYQLFIKTLTSLYLKILDIMYPDLRLNTLLLNLNHTFPLHLNFFRLKLNKSSTISGISLSDYNDPVIRDLIHYLKYTGSAEIVDMVSLTVREYLLEYISNIKMLYPEREILIIPIPITKKKYKERGFNQLHLILNHIIENDNFFTEYIDLNFLIKNRETPSQTKLSRVDRLKNLKGAFTVINKRSIKDLHIILFDDVFTTGATIAEAVKTLNKVGISKIDILTIARVI